MNSAVQVWKFISIVLISLLIFVLFDILVFILCYLFNLMIDGIVIWALVFGGIIYIIILALAIESAVVSIIEWLLKKGPSIDTGAVIVIIVAALNLLGRLGEYWSTDKNEISDHLFMRISQTVVLLYICIWSIKTSVFYIKQKDRL